MSSRSVRHALCVGFAALMCALPVSADAPSSLKVLSGAGSSSAGLFTAGPAGATLGLASGATLKLAADGAVRVFGQPQRLELDHGGKTPTWSVTLTRGRVDVDVPSKPKSAVLVSTDKGSVFVIAGKATVVAEANELYVVNAGGNVRTYVQNRFADVPVGRASRVDAEHPKGSDEALLGAPSLHSGQRLWVSAGTPARAGSLAWTAVAGASGYELELRAKGEVIGRQSTLEPKLLDAPFELLPGEYELCVRARDARGIEGAWSAPRQLRVIGVELPVGAYMEDGGIFLAGGQRVSFSNTRGLEMTYKGAGRYIPATESVGLYRNERTVVSFRFAGSDEPVIARLEPRDVFAQVFAGPKKAMWPRDHVELHVKMRTRAGGPVPSFLQIVPKVEVGVDPIVVDWRREGDDLYAQVPPRPGKGPWVIRVDVVDQFGIALGRDFVEVAEGPRAAKVASVADGKTSVRVEQGRAEQR